MKSNFLMILVLGLSSSIPLSAYASTIDVFAGPMVDAPFCPCPTSWVLKVSDNPIVSAGREYIFSSISWVEGYDDIDIRIREPDNTTVYDSIDGIPQTSETRSVANPTAGGWDMFIRTWSIGPSDESGATGVRPTTSAFEFP